MTQDEIVRVTCATGIGGREVLKALSGQVKNIGGYGSPSALHIRIQAEVTSLVVSLIPRKGFCWKFNGGG